MYFIWRIYTAIFKIREIMLAWCDVVQRWLNENLLCDGEWHSRENNNSNVASVWSVTSLVPSPRPAFCHLQYGNAGRGLGTRLISHFSEPAFANLSAASLPGTPLCPGTWVCREVEGLLSLPSKIKTWTVQYHPISHLSLAPIVWLV